MHALELLWTHTIAPPFLDYIMTGESSRLTHEEKALADAYSDEYETHNYLLAVLNQEEGLALEECKISGETANCYTLAIYQDNADYGYNGLAFDL